MIRILDGRGKDPSWTEAQYNRRPLLDFAQGKRMVQEILERVKQYGDSAILAYTNKFDGVDFQAPAQMLVSQAEIDESYSMVSSRYIEIIKQAAYNIRRFHEKQLQNSWMDIQENGVILGQKMSALEYAGVYVPGGRASYPSSVLMNVIPAATAGVKNIIMVTPPDKSGKIDPHTLAAANETGVTEIFKVGGAQAIAGLAFGTDTLPKVDKIVGPGNIYVTLAKKEVYGYADIDMIAGPSEIFIIADESSDPAFIASDLMSQAEHDPLASSVLLTDSHHLACEVKKEIEKQIQGFSLRENIESSLKNHGAIIILDTIQHAVDMANKFAPEHLELAVEKPFDWLGKIVNAGAIFMGQYSPEPVGDYMAGPNHVLPTSGTARFFSPLSVDDFMKKTSIISYTKDALKEIYQEVVDFAEAEGLTAHANSIKVRFK
jgi:histidinol dehydrogenase